MAPTVLPAIRNPLRVIIAVAVCLSPALAWAQAPPLSVADGLAIEHALKTASEFTAPSEVAGASGKLGSPDPEVRRQAETALINAAKALARGERGALQDPAKIDPNWALRPPYDADADFAAAQAHGAIAVWVASLPRKDDAYQGLLAAWRHYEVIRIAGGWKPLPPGGALAPGAKGPRVAALRDRLNIEGFASPATADPDVFDPGLAAGLAAFQARHDLSSDDGFSSETLAELNVPVEARLATLSANLERARWLPYHLQPDRIEADIARADVALFQKGQATMTMRAVVGDVKHQTPIFVSRVSSIVFNPPWVVPTSIAKTELWPKERASPGYFARGGFSVIDGQLVQHAGPKASLGFVKFDMPDPYSVYLHDTPARGLFDRDERARSHGCVRLQKPRELAAAILAPQGYTLDTVNAAIAARTTKRIIPTADYTVYILYRTAEATPDGEASFHPDVYGWDSRTVEAINHKS
jgi:murein L,D-transpeptidase YcbB/YkuD